MSFGRVRSSSLVQFFISIFSNYHGSRVIFAAHKVLEGNTVTRFAKLRCDRYIPICPLRRLFIVAMLTLKVDWKTWRAPPSRCRRRGERESRWYRHDEGSRAFRAPGAQRSSLHILGVKDEKQRGKKRARRCSRRSELVAATYTTVVFRTNGLQLVI